MHSSRIFRGTVPCFSWFFFFALHEYLCSSSFLEVLNGSSVFSYPLIKWDVYEVKREWQVMRTLDPQADSHALMSDLC